MNTARLNITLPNDLLKQLAKIPNKSHFIAEAVAEKLHEADDLRRRQELAQAYKDSAIEDAAMAQDWDVTSGDGL